MGLGTQNEAEEEEFIKVVNRNREEKTKMEEYMELITDNSRFLEVEIVNDMEKLRVTRTAEFSNAILGTLRLNKAKKRFFALIKKKSRAGNANLTPAHTRLFGRNSNESDARIGSPEELRWWQKKQKEAAIKRRFPNQRIDGPTDLRPVRDKKTNYEELLEEQHLQEMSLNQSDLQYKQLLAKYQAIQDILSGRLSALCMISGSSKTSMSSIKEQDSTDSSLPALRTTPRQQCNSHHNRTMSRSLWSSEPPILPSVGNQRLDATPSTSSCRSNYSLPAIR